MVMCKVCTLGEGIYFLWLLPLGDPIFWCYAEMWPYSLLWSLEETWQTDRFGLRFLSAAFVLAFPLLRLSCLLTPFSKPNIPPSKVLLECSYHCCQATLLQDHNSQGFHRNCCASSFIFLTADRRLRGDVAHLCRPYKLHVIWLGKERKLFIQGEVAREC